MSHCKASFACSNLLPGSLLVSKGGDALFKKVTIFLTALAILALLKHATDVGFGVALELVLEQYENIKELVLSVLQIDHFVANLAKFFSELLNLNIGPVPFSCRPMCSFRPLSVRIRPGFSSPKLSAACADCRSH